MRIVYKDSFVDRLEQQIEFIARDSPAAARRFKTELLKRIHEVPKFPYGYRKSIYFESTEIRDLIFKGYTIVFSISPDRIEVFGFVKYRNSITD